MIRRLLKGEKGSTVGSILEGRELKRTRWCESCLNVGISSPLKNRVYLDDKDQIMKTAPPDHAKWLQCHRCGTVYSRFKVKQEPELESLVKPGAKRRGLIRGLGGDRKLNRNDKDRDRKWKQLEKQLAAIEDPDLRRDVAKGGKIINYRKS